LSNLLFDVGLSLQQIIQLGLVILEPSSTHILDNVASKEVKVLVTDEVPDLNLATLIVGG
jgi:hypothetical protein